MRTVTSVRKKTASPGRLSGFPAEPQAFHCIDLAKARFMIGRNKNIPTGRTTFVTDTDQQPANDSAAIPLNIQASNPEPETQSLSDRVSAAQKRIAERTAPARAKAAEQTKAAASSTKQFVKDHPVIAIGGALAAGIAIAYALPGKPSRKLRSSTLALGGLVAELAATYGARMLSMAEDAAEASQEKLGEIGESFAAASESLADTAAETGTSVLSSIKHMGEATAAQAQSMAGKIKR